MVRLYSHPDPALTALVAGQLRADGIEAVVRGTNYGAAMGELPPVAAWSEVWVSDVDADADRVQAILAAVTDQSASEAAPWTCAACGETVDGVLGQCWSCGTLGPAA